MGLKDKIILGIDPGTTIMGYGLIHIINTKMQLIKMGVIHLSKLNSHEVRLKKIFDPEILDGHAITSSRRWKKHGYLRTILLMRLIRLLFYLGVNTKILAKIYR